MVTATFDAAHGGRWTSLSAAGREWLWHRPDPARASVLPGSSFVDAGGVEECIPTIRGVPDHGDAWSRPWKALASESAAVDTGEFRLSRTFTTVGRALVASYRLAAAPGWRFLWAAHALLDLSPSATLQAPAGTRAKIDPGCGELERPGRPESPHLERGPEVWGAATSTGSELPTPRGRGEVWGTATSPGSELPTPCGRGEVWGAATSPGSELPTPRGRGEVWGAATSPGSELPTPRRGGQGVGSCDGPSVRTPHTMPEWLARLGPDDGSATGAILLDCPTATVVDGERLTFFLEAPGQPVSTALWRNLRGWPAEDPYRSIGVEPMLGRVWDLAEAGPGDAAVVPQSGVCEWRLTVTAA